MLPLIIFPLQRFLDPIDITSSSAPKRSLAKTPKLTVVDVLHWDELGIPDQGLRHVPHHDMGGVLIFYLTGKDITPQDLRGVHHGQLSV